MLYQLKRVEPGRNFSNARLECWNLVQLYDESGAGRWLHLAAPHLVYGMEGVNPSPIPLQISYH